METLHATIAVMNQSVVDVPGVFVDPFQRVRSEVGPQGSGSAPADDAARESFYDECDIGEDAPQDPPAHASTAWSKTFAPASRCSGRASSISLWLMPSLHGTKIMEVGATRAR